MLIKLRKPILAILDAIIIYFSYSLAMKLRFSTVTNDDMLLRFLANLQSIIWIYVFVGVLILFLIGYYGKLETPNTTMVMIHTILAVTLAFPINYIIPYLLGDFSGYFLPRSVLAIAYFIQIFFLTTVRLVWRILTDKDLKKDVIHGISRNIAFSPPDITEVEIEEVVKAMKSGWITTGPRTKEFERRIAEYVGVNRAVCLNSATAAMELTLRILGVGPGDEVITSAYTYTASASIIDHVGAKIVLVDTAKNSFEMDYDQLASAITEKTKVIIPVDLAGKMCDYGQVFDAVEKKKHLFQPNNDLQKKFGRCIVMADAAHAFGAKWRDKSCGQVADFTCFSFHAVKNLTTAEGGAVVWRNDRGLDNEWLYQQYMLFSLHGQSKDALAKTQKGAWEYDIVYPAYKCNMTDILAGFGLMQLSRYESMLKRRMEIIKQYDAALLPLGIERLDHFSADSFSTGHLYLCRVPGANEAERNEIITKIAKQGIAVNVHYKPLPMFTAYKNLGFSIKDYPNAFDMYANEITLPLHTLLTNEDVQYVCKKFEQAVNETIKTKAKSN